MTVDLQKSTRRVNSAAAAARSSGGPGRNSYPPPRMSTHRFLLFAVGFFGFVGALTTVYYATLSPATAAAAASNRRVLKDENEVTAKVLFATAVRRNATAAAKKAKVVSRGQSGKGRIGAATAAAKAKVMEAREKDEGSMAKALSTVEKKQNVAKVTPKTFAEEVDSKPAVNKGIRAEKRGDEILKADSPAAKKGEGKLVKRTETNEAKKEDDATQVDPATAKDGETKQEKSKVMAKRGKKDNESSANDATSSMHKDWQKTKYTSSHYVIAGVDLATYGMGQHGGARPEPFELYSDFDISDKIRGDEGWWDLVRYRRDSRRPGLPFYVDKIAQRRWLASEGVPTTRPLVHRYASELLPRQRSSRKRKGTENDEARAILSLLPNATSYAAKPTHMSCSDGVWLVDYDSERRRVVRVGQGHDRLEDVHGKFDGGSNIAENLARNLHEDAVDMESWALKAVRPGILVEERFVGWGNDDDVPATEFKCFAVWGRVVFAQWRSGGYRGQVLRNGVIVDGESDRLPDWVDWSRVVKIAERLAAHKDMYRVDIFVGVPADSPIAKKKNMSKDEMLAVTQVVISETEIHPTSTSIEPELFEEAARLWIAGYKMGRYCVVKNTEVPTEFLNSGYLPQATFGRQSKKQNAKGTLIA